MSLYDLTFEDAYEAIISEYYRCKTYYGFVRDEYSVGFVEPVGSMLYSTVLNTKMIGSEDMYIAKHSKRDLSTFLNKQELKNELLNANKKLNIQLQKLKKYIQSRHTMDDLLA